MSESKPVKRSVVISGHRTSVSLEPIFWDLLRRAAKQRDRSVNVLVTEIDAKRDGNLSSAIRVYLVKRLMNSDL